MAACHKIKRLTHTGPPTFLYSMAKNIRHRIGRLESVAVAKRAKAEEDCRKFMLQIGLADERCQQLLNQMRLLAPGERQPIRELLLVRIEQLRIRTLEELEAELRRRGLRPPRSSVARC